MEKLHDATQWMAILVLVAQAVMVPVSWAAGHLTEKFGRRIILIASCAVLPIRGVLAALAHDPVALIAIEVLDGVGAGLISVAGPAAVADLTYGGGRTQTAMGAMGTIQSLASALSAAAAGFVVVRLGWTPAYGMLAVVPLAGIALLWTIHLRDEHPDHAKAAAIKARV
jgi:MFS family permease